MSDLVGNSEDRFSHDKAHISHLGEKVAEISCESPTFTVSWHPKRHLLAFACDDKTNDSRERDRDAGTVKLFGLPGDH